MRKKLTAVSTAIGVAFIGSQASVVDYSQGKVSDSRVLLASGEMKCGKEMKEKMESCRKMMEEMKCGKEMMEQMKECKKIMGTKEKVKEMACGKCGSMGK
ncbi:hypothetical protein SAMN06265182_0314 [Persephonella hydrogeniphila]|uniref:Uncharacterized protein n=1 Tax=Persephonella hydrogeniphila TaxID=198703 RepID=A0A285N171_9AQUI|nr:hypothetical protein [Persephonella hydrogeniphila]SNZ03180.1 hypothetical protein SAMN06265182_0314 [Persephonella hydrogeniphila]